MKKTKIGILTWLYNENYGTVLQAYALQRFLRDNGYNVENMNYRSSLKTKLINWIVNGNSPKLFMGKFENAMKKRECKSPELLDARSKKFEDFKKNYMCLSNLCTNPKELKLAAEIYELFICGSDQIWSPALMNPVYYFSFLPANSKKIAYAPSFGVTNVSDRKKRQIKGYLEKFDYVSVREKQGQSLIMEILGKEVPVQVDPTMLITANDWEKCMSERLIEKDYIFCYFLTENKEYIDSVREFAEKLKLPVVIVPTPCGPYNTGFEELIDVGPAEWLSLIKYSSYVCTDSFHGCVFSSIFHKEFSLYKRFSDSNKKSENSRIYNLASLLGIHDRIVDRDTLKHGISMKPLDYQALDKIIYDLRTASSKWLIDAVEDELSKGMN